MSLAANAWEALSHLVDLAIAYSLAWPIGWDRERSERSAGLRTFPLVAMASCGQARILEGLSTGIGFIGGGAILKHGTRALGTAAAACLWATGALGAAVGYGLYDIAVILSAVTYVTLRSVMKTPLGWKVKNAPDAIELRFALFDAQLRSRDPIACMQARRGT